MQPSPQNFFQTRRFILLTSVGLLGIITFLNAGNLLGSIYLRLANTYVGIAVATVLSYASLMVLFWNRMTRESRIGWGTVGLVTVLCVTTISPLLNIISWLVALFLDSLTVEAQAIILVVSIICWAIVSLSVFRAFERRIRLTLMGVLLITALYSFSQASTERVQSVTFPALTRLGDRTYVLYLRQRGNSYEPDTLILYDCNSVMLFCENVYEKHDGFYTYPGIKKLELASDFGSDTIGVRVDGRIIYTYDHSD